MRQKKPHAMCQGELILIGSYKNMFKYFHFFANAAVPFFFSFFFFSHGYFCSQSRRSNQLIMTTQTERKWQIGDYDSRQTSRIRYQSLKLIFCSEISGCAGSRGNGVDGSTLPPCGHTRRRPFSNRVGCAAREGLVTTFSP